MPNFIAELGAAAGRVKENKLLTLLTAWFSE